MDRIVIVGASLAGLRAAEELRLGGHTGPTALGTVTGDLDDLALDWHLGVAATGLDLASREVLLGGGDRLSYDGLVIATGATPRHLPGTDHLAGVHTLRTLDDCA